MSRTRASCYTTETCASFSPLLLIFVDIFSWMWCDFDRKPNLLGFFPPPAVASLEKKGNRGCDAQFLFCVFDTCCRKCVRCRPTGEKHPVRGGIESTEDASWSTSWPPVQRIVMEDVSSRITHERVLLLCTLALRRGVSERIDADLARVAVMEELAEQAASSPAAGLGRWRHRRNGASLSGSKRLYFTRVW